MIDVILCFKLYELLNAKQFDVIWSISVLDKLKHIIMSLKVLTLFIEEYESEISTRL